MAEKRAAIALREAGREGLPRRARFRAAARAAAPMRALVAKLAGIGARDPATHGDLGIAYKQMGLYDAAIAEFKQVGRTGRARCSR